MAEGYYDDSDDFGQGFEHGESAANEDHEERIAALHEAMQDEQHEEAFEAGAQHFEEDVEGAARANWVQNQDGIFNAGLYALEHVMGRRLDVGEKRAIDEVVPKELEDPHIVVRAGMKLYSHTLTPDQDKRARRILGDALWEVASGGSHDLSGPTHDPYRPSDFEPLPSVTRTPLRRDGTPAIGPGSYKPSAAELEFRKQMKRRSGPPEPNYQYRPSPPAGGWGNE
jgi:hypothetical protein